MQSVHESTCHVLEDTLKQIELMKEHNVDYGQWKEAKKFKDRILLLLNTANTELNNYQFFSFYIHHRLRSAKKGLKIRKNKNIYENKIEITNQTIIIKFLSQTHNI